MSPQREISILEKSFWFLLFNTLVLPSLALSSVSAVVARLTHNRLDGFSIIGQMFLEGSGSFFVCYIIQKALLSTSLELWRVVERLYLGWLRLRAVTVTERAWATDPSFKWDFELGQQYAIDLTTFAVVLAWSTMVPLILPFGVLYFLVKRYVDLHNVLYECPNWEANRDEGAQIRHARPVVGWHAIRFIPVCLMAYQAAMAGFFSLRGTTVQFMLLALLFLGTMAAYIRWYYVFSKAHVRRIVAAGKNSTHLPFEHGLVEGLRGCFERWGCPSLGFPCGDGGSRSGSVGGARLGGGGRGGRSSGGSGGYATTPPPMLRQQSYGDYDRLPYRAGSGPSSSSSSSSSYEGPGAGRKHFEPISRRASATGRPGGGSSGRGSDASSGGGGGGEDGAAAAKAKHEACIEEDDNDEGHGGETAPLVSRDPELTGGD